MNVRKTLAIVVMLSLGLSAPPLYGQGRFGRIVPATVPSSSLTISNLSCTGTFLTPGVSVGNRTSNIPIAMRYESGARHYFIYDGTGEVYGFAEPSLSPCSTAVGSVTRATIDIDWGEFRVQAGGDYDPGCFPGFSNCATVAQGLTWDETLGYLVLHWAGTYSQTGVHNTFGAVTLNNVSHTMSLAGCWGINGITQPRVGTGMLLIPSAFVSSYLTAGARWGIGQGYYNATIGAGVSMGPSFFAVVPPATNPCTANTDTLVSGTNFEDHPTNNVGPTCFVSTPGQDGIAGQGCTPSVAPTTPYPAQLANTNYTAPVYPESWDPYGGHGWIGFGDTGKLAWYDDDTRRGVVSIVYATEGAATTSVVSSSSATAAVIASTSTHDGFNMNPGDTIWIQTCTVGVDTGCEQANGNWTSEVRLTSVNTSTGAITYTVTNSDSGAGNHFGVVGGPVYFGCVYAHASPTCSRATLRMQVFDPSQYAEVLGSTRAAYNVVATDDQRIDNTLITNLGSYSAGGGVRQASGGGGGAISPSAIIADTTGHDIIVAFSGVGSPLTQISAEIYVLHVNSSAPEPTLLEWLWSLAPDLRHGVPSPKSLLEFLHAPR